MRIGDLVYVPSGVLLYKFLGEGRVPVKWEKLHEPARMLICGEVDNFYKVFYQGTTWHALKDVTTLLQGRKNDC